MGVRVGVRVGVVSAITCGPALTGMVVGAGRTVGPLNLIAELVVVSC